MLSLADVSNDFVEKKRGGGGLQAFKAQIYACRALEPLVFIFRKKTTRKHHLARAFFLSKS